MAIPSSGQLKLNADINLEINGTATGTNVSLNSLSIAAGFTAPNGMEEFYGYVDAVVPSVSTSSTISITTSSMTIRGNVTSDGGASITERGFYFGTSTNATSNTKYTVSGTTGAFTRSMTGLSSGTTYRIFAFATNSVGTTIGSMITTATSQPALSSILTASVPNYYTYNAYTNQAGYNTHSGRYVGSAVSGGYTLRTYSYGSPISQNYPIQYVGGWPNGGFPGGQQTPGAAQNIASNTAIDLNISTFLSWPTGGVRSIGHYSLMSKSGYTNSSLTLYVINIS